jgi:hypothetical protein
VTEAVMKSLPATQQKYITKAASENYGIGKTLVEWNYQSKATCPRCAQLVETPAHVQQCEGYSANEIFKKNISKVEDFLSQEQTRPDLQDAIIQCIKKWRAREPIQLKEYQDDIQAVIRQQHVIGWMDMMECLPARGWQRLQRQFYQDQNIRKSSRKWIVGVLKQLQHLGHQQWKHRCDVKANVTRPQEKEHVDIMHDEIERQFVLGSEELLPGDRSIMDYSILNLLRRSLAYKKGWLTRIWAARQRAQRIARSDDELIVQSKEAECLIKWMRHHKDRPKRKTRRQREMTDDVIMEETEAQHNDFISDAEYLVENVRESMDQQMDSSNGQMEDETKEQLEVPRWMEISEVFSGVNQSSGFGGPHVNAHSPCNLIVDRNP